MAETRLLEETPLAERRLRRVLDGTVADYRPQLVEHLHGQSMPQLARLFALAAPQADRVSWFTDLPGEIVAFAALPTANQATAMAALAAMLDDLRAEADRLRGLRAAGARTLAGLFDAALQGATLADIFLVGGELVLAGWGMVASEGRPPLPDLVGSLRRPAVPPGQLPPGQLLPRQVPAPAPALPLSPLALAPPLPPLRWPLRLLAASMLLLFLTALLAWFLPDLARAAAFGLRLPPALLCAPQAGPGPKLMALQQDEMALRQHLATLQARIAERALQCRMAAAPPAPRPPPATALQPAPPAPSINERLQRERAQSGKVQISLAWDSEDDLDVSVTCPDGQTIYFHTRAACGGRLDTDANGISSQLTRSPVENIFWANRPPSGQYRVYVGYYNYDARRRSVPYLVRLTIDGQQREFRGTATQQAPRLVTEFDVP
jgi:hypothetical protein